MKGTRDGRGELRPQVGPEVARWYHALATELSLSILMTADSQMRKLAWIGLPDAIAKRLEVHLGRIEEDGDVATRENRQRYVERAR